MKKLLLPLLAAWISVSFATPSSLEKLTVVLDRLPNPNHAPLIIAKQQGYFKEQGLDVTFMSSSEQTYPLATLLQGKAHIGISDEPELLQLIDKGYPLIRVGTLIDKPLSSLVTLQTNQIHSIADLKGKRIGYNENSLSTIMLKTMLTKAGITNQEVTWINVHNQGSRALMSHRVDAIAGMLRNYEVPLLEIKHQKVITFFPEENGIPTYSKLVFISSIQAKNDPRFPRFLAAIKKGVRYLDDHPRLAWQHFAKQYPKSNNSLNRQMWFTTMPYFAEDPASFNSKEWLHFADYMQKNQLIKKVQPISLYAIKL